MSRTVTKPGYRKQKRTGTYPLAFVEIDGQRTYLGKYNSAASLKKYAAIIAEWEAGGGHAPVAESDELSIVELVDRYWTYASGYYRNADGSETSELYLVKRAMGPLVKLYGDLPASDFSPLKLKAVREAMVQRNWCRRTINQMVQRIKRMFAWATEDELIPPDIHHGLEAVKGLKKGRCDARDLPPVRPVRDDSVEAVLEHVAPPIKAMIELHLLTGMRPGEICMMRGADIDTSGQPWIYRPAHHKTEHHGEDHQRLIPLGPKAQQIISPFRKLDPKRYVFEPREAVEWHRQRRRENRKTPLYPSHVLRYQRQHRSRPRRTGR